MPVPRQLYRARNEIGHQSDLLKFLQCTVVGRSSWPATCIECKGEFKGTANCLQVSINQPFYRRYTACYLVERLRTQSDCRFDLLTVLLQLPRSMKHICICRHKGFQYLVLTLKNALTWNKWYSKIFSLLHLKHVRYKSESVCTLYGAGQLSSPKMVSTFCYLCCFLPCKLCDAN